MSDEKDKFEYKSYVINENHRQPVIIVLLICMYILIPVTYFIFCMGLIVTILQSMRSD